MKETKKTLLILAAGMGSRYGGLKQIDGVGPSEEAIIEYSIYDAIQSGFNKIVFIIRRQFEEAFKAKFMSSLEGKIEVVFVYQEFDAPIGGRDLSKIYREKPWGTGHAVLVAKDVINEPFAVINADDYYGQESFKTAADYIDQGKCTATNHSLVAYVLNNTLSDHGHVNRGVCTKDENGNLKSIEEALKITRSGDKITHETENFNGPSELDENTPVSMNFWLFHPSIFEHIERGFLEFVDQNPTDPKAEYFIPSYVDELINTNQANFEVIETNAQWFGVTYREDKPIVMKSFKKMVEEGKYPSKLWEEKTVC